MADNTKGIPFSQDDEGVDYPKLVKLIAYDQAMALDVLQFKPDFSIDDVYVVWFNYTLGNFKALCSTSVPDGRYYEVTYNKNRGIGFVDTYLKTHNIEFTLNEENN